MAERGGGGADLPGPAEGRRGVEDSLVAERGKGETMNGQSSN